MPPQPRRNPLPTPPSQRQADDFNPTVPEITVLIHPEAMKQFEGPHLEYMKSFFGSVLFENWVKEQIKLTEDNQRGLHVGRFNAEQFYQLSKDYRLLWRVWHDLLQFAIDSKPQSE